MRVTKESLIAGFLAFALGFAMGLLPSPVRAQSGCAIFFQGNVPTPGQWNQCSQTKQDTLGYTPINSSGDAMTGRLVTAASTTFRAGFNIAPGIAPASPVNGDMWVTSSGLFARINNSTVGPFTASGSTVPSVVQGDLVYGSAPATLSALAKSTSATRYLSNTGASNNPAWAQVDLTSGVTGALPLANIATGTQDTVLGYFGSTTASAVALTNCVGALTYRTSTHTFGCNASGTVIVSGAPTANQIAQWTSLTTIQGVNLASLLNVGGGISITGTTSPTIARAYNEATLTTQTPANPAGTTSTTGAMMGLGSTCAITPTKSGRVRYRISGNILNNTAGNNVSGDLRFGTGTAPVNNAAATGTKVGSTFVIAIVANSFSYQATLEGVVSGLTLSVATWFDANIFTTNNTVGFTGVQCDAFEF